MTIGNLGANVLITGANKGIGLGLVREILKLQGVKNVFATCRNPDAAEDLKQMRQTNNAVKIIKIDATNDEQIYRARDEVNNEIGNEGLHLLINNSGIFEPDGCTIQNPNRQVFMRHFDTNTMGTVMTTAAFLPLLRKASSHNRFPMVVNMSSILGGISQMIPVSIIPHNSVAYGMSKAAINHYTKALSIDEPSIVAISIHPGWVATDMGGDGAQITIEFSTKAIVKKLCSLTKEDTGKFMDYEKTMKP